MSDLVEPTREQLKMELDVCREEARAILEHHKSMMRTLTIIFALTQVLNLCWALYWIFAR